MSSDMIRVTGINSGLDTESIISAYTSTAKKRVTDARGKLQINKWTQDTWKDINSKIYGFYSKTLSSNRLSSAYSKTKTTTTSSALTVVGNENSVPGVQTAQIKSTASAAYLTGNTISADSDSYELSKLGIADGDSFTFTNSKGTTTIQIGGEASDGVKVVKNIGELTNAFKELGINANFDAGNHRFFLSAKQTGEGNDFNLGGDTETLAKLGLATEKQIEDAGLSEKYTDNAKKIEASSAELILNGASFKSDSNSFVINGSTYTINGMPSDPNEKISVTTSTDYDGVYDVIKDMLKEYNSLVNEMSKLYNAESAKGYNPLTDEQKEEMTDKEIEDWENKIKSALLKGDDTLNDVMNALTNTSTTGFEINGETVYLSDFGIATMGYFDAEVNERYALHIDGDPDDGVTSGNTDKLKSLIASDPEKVTSFFTKFSNAMYENLYSKMGSSSLSSIYKVYNDKQLKTEQSDWEKKIVELEDKLSDMEDKYYKRFSTMESTLAKINSRQSSVSSFFG